MNYPTTVGFFDELSKIAQETSGERAANIGAGLGIGIGSSMVGRGLAGAVGQNLQEDVARSGLTTTQAEAEKIRKAMGVKSGVHVVEGGGHLGQAMHIPKGGSTPKFMRSVERAMYEQQGIPREAIEKGFKEGISVAPGSGGAHLAAHELGHGKFRQGRVGQFLAKARMPGGLVAGFGAPILAGAADPDSTASKLAPVVGAAGVAPLLADEGYASLKGYRTMKRMGYNKAALKAGRRQLLKAFGTYGLGVAAPAIAAPVAIRAFKKWRQKSKGEPAQAE